MRKLNCSIWHFWTRSLRMIHKGPSLNKGINSFKDLTQRKARSVSKVQNLAIQSNLCKQQDVLVTYHAPSGNYPVSQGQGSWPQGDVKCSCPLEELDKRNKHTKYRQCRSSVTGKYTVCVADKQTDRHTCNNMLPTIQSGSQKWKWNVLGQIDRQTYSTLSFYIPCDDRHLKTKCSKCTILFQQRKWKNGTLLEKNSFTE